MEAVAEAPGTLGPQEQTDTDPQYLTFGLGGVEYGIEILKVQEIKGSSVVTPVPNTPPFVRGVMNLRGTVIPVVDLRTRLAIVGAPPTGPTVIIVVSVGVKLVGLIVDAVSDVLDVRASDVDPAPDLGSGIEARFLQGIARLGERLVVLLDIDRLLATSSASLVVSGAPGAPAAVGEPG